MTTSAMARPRCSPPSTSPPGRSSDSATGATAARSSGSSWITSRPTVPPDLDIHIVMDNYSTHKTKTIRDWFAGVRAGMSISRRPLPHGSTQVERFFADLTEKQIRRGVHRSTAELERAITDYIETVNEAPSRSDGTSRPTTSWHPSSASASGPSKPQRSPYHKGTN